MINENNTMVLSLILLLSGCTTVDASSITTGDSPKPTNLEEIHTSRTASNNYEDETGFVIWGLERLSAIL